MKVIEFEKNSEEWLEFRKGKSSGSKMKDLFPARDITGAVAKNYLEEQGKIVPEKAKVSEILDMLSMEDIGKIKAQGSKKDEFYKLVAERVSRPITPNDYIDKLNGQAFSMMARGHILEPEAIAEFEKRNKVETKKRSVVWVNDDDENSIYSPDGEVTDEWNVEIKCLDTHKMIRAWHENAYPDEFFGQIVKSFIVNEKQDRLSFVMFTDVMPALPYLQFDIYRKDIEKEIREYKAFEDEILKQVGELAEKLEF